MTDVEYQQWWQYHIRIARGESLNDEEQALYLMGTDELDREEAERAQFASLANLRQLRNQVQLLTQNLAQLTKHSELLSSRIVTLEQTYQQLTGYPLLLDVHDSTLQTQVDWFIKQRVRRASNGFTKRSQLLLYCGSRTS